MEQEFTHHELFADAVKVTAPTGVATVMMSPIGSFAKSKKPEKLYVSLLLKENESLKRAGGAVFIKNPNSKNNILLFRESESVLHAFSSKYTGSTTPLQSGMMECTHGFRGEMINGPADKIEKKYTAVLEKDSVIVTL